MLWAIQSEVYISEGHWIQMSSHPRDIQSSEFPKYMNKIVLSRLMLHIKSNLEFQELKDLILGP